jgi:hypothetical protein
VDLEVGVDWHTRNLGIYGDVGFQLLRNCQHYASQRGEVEDVLILPEAISTAVNVGDAVSRAVEFQAVIAVVNIGRVVEAEARRVFRPTASWVLPHHRPPPNHPSARFTLAQDRPRTNHFSPLPLTGPIPYSKRLWQHYDLCRLELFLSAIGLAFVSTDFGSHQWNFGPGNRDPVFRL